MRNKRKKQAEQQTILEEIIVEDLQCFDNYSLIWMTGLPVGQRHVVRLLKQLADLDINVNQMLQITDRQGLMSQQLIVRTSDFAQVFDKVKNLYQNINTGGEFGICETITRLVLKGSGIKIYSNLTTKVFDVLDEKKIKVHLISSSEMSLSIYIDSQQAAQALSAFEEIIETLQ